ncbi:hypothetical protein PNEG_01607 [Pneumocystis murina B123]|uniref:Las1p n=1 Tax=Pneumocystis murina (strain B123) TaxID=1069680 RepID=M7PIS8_PNEMU|nr:hypothetical protein PNEG_01607 [Pneumocystis murina B123]EMR10354.1 hypothetical protein PNEG_01607 [Pneumocystis murina B123]
MNLSFRIVPWRSRSEFNQVRDWFYGTDRNQESLMKGLSRVNAWQVRGRLPHAVESTANLVCVLVEEERGICNPLGLRLSYAMALIRFVNGFLDPEQQGQYIIPMQTLARNINLPLSFVEIRHAATHEQLPSLVVLRSMTIRALEWLLDKYWSRSYEDIEGMDEKKIQDIIKKWEIFQEKNLDKGSKSKDSAKEMSIIIKESIILCNSSNGVEIITNYLLEKIMALPKNMKKEDFFNRSYAIWLPFIKKVSFISDLVQHFALKIISKLGSNDPKNNYMIDPLPIFSLSALKGSLKNDINDVCHILLLWLQNLLNEKYQGDISAKSLFPQLSIHKIIHACLLQTDSYTAQFLKNIVLSDQHLLKSYHTLISLRLNIATFPQKKHTLDDIEIEVNAFKKRFYTLTRKVDDSNSIEKKPLILANGRWKKWHGKWVSKPIGIP